MIDLSSDRSWKSKLSEVAYHLLYFQKLQIFFLYSEGLVFCKAIIGGNSLRWLSVCAMFCLFCCVYHRSLCDDEDLKYIFSISFLNLLCQLNWIKLTWNAAAANSHIFALLDLGRETNAEFNQSYGISSTLFILLNNSSCSSTLCSP